MLFKKLLYPVFSSHGIERVREEQEEQTYLFWLDFLEEVEGMYIAFVLTIIIYLFPT